MKDNGFVIEQHITNHTTCGTCNTSQDDSNPERLSEEQAFLDAGNGKECKTERVEHEPRILQPFHLLMEEDDEKQGYRRANQVHGGGHPERCSA